VTTIRSYGPTDDAAQVSIYNEAAAALPKFKPATLDEVRRRARDPAYNPSDRFVAVVDGRPTAYATFQTNGRVSFPWSRQGHEDLAEPLLEHVLGVMRQRGLSRAWAAYRPDWVAPLDFFRRHGFEQRREMAGFQLHLADMPTPMAHPRTNVSPLRVQDLPAVLDLGQGVLRARDAGELGRHLFDNPYFAAESVFAVRSRPDGPPLAVGILVSHSTYTAPGQTDACMPCFRLGAFGTEGLTAKRVNGLFSFLAPAGRDLNPLALDLMGHAALLSEHTDVATFAAQVPTDAPHLLAFYSRYFRRQGSFPILERDL
jgi:hypothetical protein